MTTEAIYDVIIVGLGPGGSSAAFELAKRGLRVLALEKHKMPRAKPCGGCLSAKLQSIIEDDLAWLAETKITRVIITFRGQNEIVVESPEPVAYMVMREKFDHYLVKKAARAGVEIQEAERVNAIRRNKGVFEVKSAKGTYRSRYLIGADGVNGLTSRMLGYGPKRHLAVALEGEVKVTSESFAQMHETVRLDIGEIPYGYGWLFPKKDHWSIGVGSMAELAAHPKRYYSAFVENQNLQREIVEEQRQGYRIPLFGGVHSKITGKGSLLVGDAAALVDPFLGEGIYYAIRSGQLAAQTIHQAFASQSDNLSGYEKSVAAEMYPEFKAAARIAKFGFQFSRLSYTLFKAHPEVAGAFVRILQGSLSYRQYWRKISEISKYGLFGFLRLLKTDRARTKRTYDRVAQNYDALRFYWQETVAREAMDYYDSFLREHVRDGARVLDAGTGTGEAVKRLLQIAKPGSVVGIDLSTKMLDIARRKTSNPRVSFQPGNFTRLPFRDSSFDVVMSSWAIETCNDPRRAVDEFLRVVKEDGYVIYIFSSLPKGIKRFYAFAIEKFLGGTFDWHFLNKRARPFHDCRHSSLTTFADGLITVAVLRKCCTVTPDAIGENIACKWKPEKVIVP